MYIFSTQDINNMYYTSFMSLYIFSLRVARRTCLKVAGLFLLIFRSSSVKCSNNKSTTQNTCSHPQFKLKISTSTMNSKPAKEDVEVEVRRACKYVRMTSH